MPAHHDPPLHAESEHYDVEGFLAGGCSLDEVELAERTGVPAGFAESDVCRVDQVLPNDVGIVFLSKGILVWIEDIVAFARATVGLLRPGGRYYLLDLHPLTLSTRFQPDQLVVTDSYSHRSQPRRVVSDGYALSDAGLVARETREWTHPIGDVVSTLIDAGLVIEFLHEHPAQQDPCIPGMFSVSGIREG